MKRLVLINAPTKIMINNELIYLPSLVSKLIAEHYNIPLNKVLYQFADSYIVRYKVKDEKDD